MDMLLDLYRTKVSDGLMDVFKYKNRFSVPRIEKVVINMGLGVVDDSAMERSFEELSNIAGQRPCLTTCRRSVANFKTRVGMPLGFKVTLRKKNMFYFLERLIYVALPRIRNFKGFSKRGFTGSCRYSFSTGLKEQDIFPEIDYGSIDKVRGMDVAIVTTAKTCDECIMLLTLLGMPFRD